MTAPAPVSAATLPRVLVVEDEVRARESTAALLRLAGYRTELAADGREALHRLLDGRDAAALPDVLLLDVQMPYLTGLELLDRLDEAGIALPTIAVTGFGDRHTVLELMRRGCSDVLDKPIEPDELLARMARVRARQPHPRAEPRAAATGGPLALEIRARGRDGAAGGDWWASASQGAHAGIAVCDAAGTDPALRALLERWLPHGGPNRGEALLRLLNRDLLRLDGDQARLAACVALVDLDALALEVVSTGHLPLLVQAADDAPARIIDASAANLRQHDRYGFERRRLGIRPGDRVVLCTDGVVRAAGAPADGRQARFGLERLQRALGGHRAAPLAAAVDAAWAALDEFAGGRCDDDRLLLAFDIPASVSTPTGACA